MSADPHYKNGDIVKESTASELTENNEYFFVENESNIYDSEILEFEIMWDSLQRETQLQENLVNFENIFQNLNLNEKP